MCHAKTFLATVKGQFGIILLNFVVLEKLGFEFCSKSWKMFRGCSSVRVCLHIFSGYMLVAR